MLTVMKFGGSSVADLEHIRNVANRCIAKQREGSQVVVVLSAMGKTTDNLIATAKQITEQPSRRELDMLLTTGEQVSVSLMAMTLISMGVSAVSLNAWQVPMHTVALAAELHADVCEIYTDVDGVYTADPRVVPNAHKMTEITYDEMLEMASLGAKVLHSRCVEIAKKYGVELLVCSSLNHNSGTIVREKTKMEKMLIR